MTQTTAASIVDSAIEATIASLEAHGHAHDVERLSKLFSDAFARRGDSSIAVLTTPREAHHEFVSSVTHALEKKLGKHVELRCHIDPALIGGAVLTVGSERIDVSVRGALDELASRLQSSASTSH